MAGADGSGLDRVVGTNLIGAYHCLELGRRHERAARLPLDQPRLPGRPRSTRSPLTETQTRFELADDQRGAGASARGIAEDFPLEGARTLYGATKLAAELLIAEYAQTFGLRAVVNRCGVIAGPWQMGKVDQGVFTHWMLAHHFRPTARATSASAAAASRCATCSTSTTSSTWSTTSSRDPGAGRGSSSTSAAAASAQPLAARDDRALPRAHRQRGPSRGVAGDRARGRAVYLSDCDAALRAHRLAAASSAARDPQPTCYDWIVDNERELGAALAID